MKIFDAVLDLLYPPRCILCRKVLDNGKVHFCRKCAGELPGYMMTEARCDLKHVTLCAAPFDYRDAVRDSLRRYKFSSAAAYGPIYADFIVKSIDENQISCDIISWVPLSRKRLRERGYDQSEIIARAVADKLGLPCERFLEKTKNNKRQSTLKNREARKSNVVGAYRCVAEEKLLCKRVLIVDDIVTTGATLSECASVLKKAGCLEVYAAAVASRMS